MNGQRTHSHWFTGVVLRAAVLGLLLGWPAGMLVHEAVRAAGRSRAESLGPGPAAHTLALVLLTAGIALPIGTAAALALCRSDLPGRGWLRFVCILPALVPLDIHATAWLATLGPQGLARMLGLPLELAGIWGAAWVHAMASIAWVIGIVGAAVSTVEGELEEDCLLVAGALSTVWHVTLRRSLGAVIAAGLLVAVFAAGEMTVTDLLVVRTYAELVYVRFAIDGETGVAAAAAVPGLVVLIGVVTVAARLVLRHAAVPWEAWGARRPVFGLGRCRWVVLAAVGLVIVLTLGVPLGSLVWRAGLVYARTRAPAVVAGPRSSGAPPGATAGSGAAAEAGGTAGPSGGAPRLRRPRWSLAALGRTFVESVRQAGLELRWTVALALVGSLVAVSLAWWLAWGARESGAGRVLAAGAAIVLLALPGPVLGAGLSLAMHRTIGWWGLDPTSWLAAPGDWLAAFSESPAVLVWVFALRTLPYALVVLWPAVRLVDRSVLEAAALDGAGALGRFWGIALPACLPALGVALLLALVLAMGELGAAILVTPPTIPPPLSVRIFTLAHSGVDRYVAGICLVQLATLGLGVAAVLLALRRAVQGTSGSSTGPPEPALRATASVNSM